jgi:hypothetical protein
MCIPPLVAALGVASRSVRGTASLSVLVGTVLALVVSLEDVAAQRAPAPATSAQIPRTADGKPDFTGMWDNPKPPKGGGAATVFDKSQMAPFVPGGEALFYEPRTGDLRHDEPRAFCMPSGFPSAFLGPYPIQIIQTPQTLVMITEFMRVTRLIPLDGRPHAKDIEPTFYGDPVGHWEGDTLVIDSTNYKRWSLDDWYYQNPKEYRMHSDAFHTIERLRRVDADTITYQFTVDDPKIFTRPWSADWQMKRHPEWEKTGLFEMVCNENNRCEGGNCKAQK